MFYYVFCERNNAMDLYLSRDCANRNFMVFLVKSCHKLYHKHLAGLKYCEMVVFATYLLVFKCTSYIPR